MSEMLDLADLIVADAPMQKKNSFTPFQSILKYWSKNRPWVNIEHAFFTAKG